MLIPLVIQLLGNGRPLLAMFLHILDQNLILLFEPVLLHLGGIEVVEPPFPALLRRPEVLPVRLDEEILAQIAPLQPIIVPLHQFFEELVLLVHPLLVLIVLLQQIFGLIDE